MVSKPFLSDFVGALYGTPGSRPERFPGGSGNMALRNKGFKETPGRRGGLAAIAAEFRLTPVPDTSTRAAARLPADRLRRFRDRARRRKNPAPQRPKCSPA